MEDPTSTSKKGISAPLMRLKEFSSDFFPKSWETLLSGVVAFVDVRTDSDNRSKGIEMEMEKLGATVVRHFSKKVTHVIFKDGSKPIYDKAKGLGIPILSYLWVVACKDKGEIVSTQEYPAINSQDYDSPYFKWRKIKSMQPNDLDEEMKRVEQKLARRRKKTQGFSLENKEEPLLPYTPIVERKSAIDTLIESSPLIQERIHQELASGKSYNDIFTLKEGEEDDFDNYLDTPLMIKFIARNYYSPLEPPPPSIRKILSDVKSQASTPAVGGSAKTLTKVRLCQPVEEEDSQVVASPLSHNSQMGNKRKRNKSASALSSAKKRKENIEDAQDKMPRRKLLFQSRLKFACPQDPLVAVTPEESPKKVKRKHPCFSQATEVARPSEPSESKPIVAPSFSPPYKSRSRRKSVRRDSLADFRLSSPRKRIAARLQTEASLVCTSLHSDAIPVVEGAVEALRGFKMVDVVNDTTTHIICGDARRTMNVMHGVVRGLKLVTFQWVTDSTAAGLWLDEDKYPVERFSAAATLYRQKKIRLFEDYPSIYVSSKSLIPSRDLTSLIRCAGGHVTTVSKTASVVVGQWKPQVNVPCVSGTWILDCIEKGLTLPLIDHLLTCQ